MSGNFGLPVLNLQSALGSIGDAYGDSFDKARQKTALAKLGEHLKAGDYAGAASTAFDSGDPQTGIGLLKLGQQQRQQQLGAEATRDLAASFGLGGPQAGSGPRADASPASRAVPSFADDSGPAGNYVTGLFKRESNNNDYAQAPTSSARGAGQFTQGTWNRVAAQNPGLNLTPVGNGQDGRTDRGQMLRATNALTAQNEGVLQQSNLPVTDASRYALHFLGAGGGRRLVAGAMSNPDAPALTYANPDQVRANRNVFFDRTGAPKSAGQVMADFGRSFGGGGGSRQGAAPAGGGQVAYADDEAQTQALEQRMGMVPRQTASLDPRADMPAEGSQSANFQIPGGSAPVPPGLSGSDVFRGARPLPSSDPNARNLPPAGMQPAAVPTLGGPAATGRRMTMPGADGAEGQGAPVQLAENTMVGGVPAGVIAQAAPGQRIQALQRALLNPNTPDGVREFASTMLKQTLDETKMPDGVKEFVYARSHGWTQAQTPGAYAQEKLRNPGQDLDAQIETRAAAAQRFGMQPGTPEFQSYVLGNKPAAERQTEAEKLRDAAQARRQIVLDQGGSPNDPRSQAYIRTGKDPREDAQPLTAGDKKVINQAEDQALLLDQTIDTLNRAKELNGQTFTGAGAGVRGKIGSSLPDWMVPDFIADPKTSQATREFGQVMSMEAIKAMSTTLKGATTDTEMGRFIDILGDPATPPPIRERTLNRMLTLAQRQKALDQSRMDDLRGGTYYRPGGGQPSAAPRASDPRSLPAPSPSNRPDAPPAADRFKQLSASGLSKAEVYQRLHDEGY